MCIRVCNVKKDLTLSEYIKIEPYRHITGSVMNGIVYDSIPRMNLPQIIFNKFETGSAMSNVDKGLPPAEE